MQNTVVRRHFLLGTGPAAALAGAAPPAAAAARPFVFDVRVHGAAGDGARLDTRAIQGAIDACAQAGGGTVWFPAGVYLSGTIVLKSHITLALDAGAVLLGSRNLADYPPHIAALRSYTDTYTEKSLIYAEGLENVAIQGRGIIDGQGAAFQGAYKLRPHMLRFTGCRNVSVSGVSIKDSPMWVQHYLDCEGVDIRGISVHSRVNANNDGIDIDCCRKVRISDCDIWSGDDAVVLKATADRPCKDVVVSNCVLSTRCNALKLGTESNGGFENIAISNCAIYETGLAGIAVEMVDGGILDRVMISNITMNGVGAPIFIRLGDRGRPFLEGGAKPAAGRLRNVSISGVEAINAGKTGCAIAGLPDHPIENVTLENIRLTFAGGGTATDARREVPEKTDAYPEFRMFGTLPAYGFYCRHVSNLSLRGIQTGVAQADERPALVCDDVEGAEVANCAFHAGGESEPAIRFTEVRDAFVHGCRAAGSAGTWLRAGGGRTRNISVTGNDLSRARKMVEMAPEVGPDVLFQDANRPATG